MTKRMLDIFLSTMALAGCAPVMVIIALAILSQNDGPVLFRQTRIGRFGYLFTLYKFRTMKEASGAIITVGADPRITPIGKFLRRTKLDELPQFFNVLRGDMSLVGPRPETPEYLQHYKDYHHGKVLALRPGITDLASIKYRNEADLLAQAADPLGYYVDVILPDKLDIAAQYANRQSLMLDLQIVWLTVAALVYPNSKMLNLVSNRQKGMRDE